MIHFFHVFYFLAFENLEKNLYPIYKETSLKQVYKSIMIIGCHYLTWAIWSRRARASSVPAAQESASIPFSSWSTTASASKLQTHNAKIDKHLQKNKFYSFILILTHSYSFILIHTHSYSYIHTCRLTLFFHISM